MPSYYKMPELLELSIGTEDDFEPINALELADFLLHFRAAYVTALEFADRGNITGKRLAKLVRDRAAVEPALSIARISRKILSPNLDLEFTSISRQSPLKFVTYSVGISMVALSAAVILSGGKVNLREGTYEVPSLGSGVRELKEALAPKSDPKAPSRKSIKPTR